MPWLLCTRRWISLRRAQDAVRDGLGSFQLHQQQARRSGTPPPGLRPQELGFQRTDRRPRCGPIPRARTCSGAHAGPLLQRAGVTRSTMMGFGCLRLDGDFFATCDHRTGDLVVKFDEARVTAMLDSGAVGPFAPNGRRFPEWASIPFERRRSWAKVLDEALQAAGRRFSYHDQHHGDSRISLWCPALPGVQEELVGTERDRFFRLPTSAAGTFSRWLGVFLDTSGENGVNWGEIAAILDDAYRSLAPRELVADLDNR